MGKLVFGMMQSLDGYVDGAAGRLELPPPGVALARHFAPLRIVASDRVGEDAVRLTCVPV